MSDLYQRLKALRKGLKEGRTAETLGAHASTPPRAILPTVPLKTNARASVTEGGWVLCAEQVWARTLEVPIDRSFWNMLALSDKDQETLLHNAEGIFCIDTETTGLSGGAGTVPFLIGWCQLNGTMARVRQFFLQDFGGESEFIRLIDAELSNAREISTYNGSSFDLPLLRMRWALQGKEFPLLPHTDCLHPARRLWKRDVGACSLKRIEEAVLGVRRVDDVPGAAVPQMYFEYLRAGAGNDFPSTLTGIFTHHVQDVHSLLLLHLLIKAVGANPLSSTWSTCFGSIKPDPWGLTKWCNADEKLILAKMHWQKDGDPQWGLIYASLCRSGGNIESVTQACAVWQELWHRQHETRALVAWLKYVEHRSNNPELWKIAIVEIKESRSILNGMPLVADDLDRRLMRLEKKLHRLESLPSLH